MKTHYLKGRSLLIAAAALLASIPLNAATASATVNPTVKILDESGTNALAGATAPVYMKIGSYYYNQGSTSNGSLVVSGLTAGNNYDFYVDYNHGRKYFSITAGTDSAFIQATKVSVNINNCNGLVTSGSNGAVAIKGNIDGYYWNMGATSGGTLVVYLLDANYTFRMDYNHGRNEKSTSVSGTSQSVDFNATCVSVTVSNCNGLISGTDNPLSQMSQNSPASFGLRKLTSSYSGKAIKVRRSSDNSTQDIGFLSSGELDTADLKTFVGSGDGFVTVWYDQSGNSRDASQANTGRQPRIVHDGVVERQNNKPAIRFLGMNYGLFTSNFTAYGSGVSFNGVAKVNSNLTYNAIVNKTGTTNKNVPAPLDFYNKRFVVGNGSGYTFIDHSNAFNASQPLGIWTYQGTPGGNLHTFYNSAANGSSSIGSHYSDNGQPLYIGSRADLVTGLDGWISEIVTFAAELSSTDRAILESSQGSYYGISGPAPVGTGAVAAVAIKGNIDGYYWNMGNTADGLLKLNLLEGSYDVRMDYNHGRNVQTAAIAGSSQTVDFATTCVAVRVLDYNSAVLSTNNASVAMKGNIDGYYWNMGNTTNGVLLLNLLPNSYDFRMDYNHGRNYQTASISGSSQNVDFATTRVSVAIADCNSVKVNGATGSVAIKGNIDGYYWNMGSTSNGLLELDLLPETYDFRTDYNHYRAYNNTAVSGTTQTVEFKTTLVSIAGSSISFKGNIDGYFWNYTNSMYMLPGNYVFKIGGIESGLVVSGCSISQKAIIVKLLSSANAGISGGVVDYYVSGWVNNVATTDVNGNALVLLPGNTNNAYFRMGYNNAKQQKGSFNVNLVTTVTFQTSNVTVELRNSSNALYNNEGTNVQYYVGGWHTFGSGTTSSGTCSMELLPVNYYFRLTYAYQTQQKGSINLGPMGSSPVIAFQTVATGLRLLNAAGNANLTGDNLEYYVGGWHQFGDGSTDGATETVELLPGNYYFRMNYAYQTQQKGSMYIGSSQTVDFQTVNMTLELLNAAGNATLTGTNLEYYVGGWHAFGDGSTDGTSETVELLPGNYYFRMTYAYQTQQKGSMYIGSSQTLDFQTVDMTLRLLNAAGNATLTGTNLEYYVGGWHTFGDGSTDGTSETYELLPGNYYFRMSYESATQQKGSMPISGATTLDFQTVLVTQNLSDNSVTPVGINGGSAEYYVGGWHTFGTTDANGDASKELLPANYYFRMSYNSFTKQKGSYNINAATTINYTYDGSSISRVVQNKPLEKGNKMLDGSKMVAKTDNAENAKVETQVSPAGQNKQVGNQNGVGVAGIKCYPNPFTTTTQVQYELLKDQNVNISVYNAVGALVAQLQNGVQEAGVYTATLDGDALSGGIYYIKIITGSEMSQIPVILHK